MSKPVSRTKKSRVVYASVQTFKGLSTEYHCVIPYDKKGRVIPSSVNCAYNADYFSREEAMLMSGAL